MQCIHFFDLKKYKFFALGVFFFAFLGALHQQTIEIKQNVVEK